MVFMQVNGVKKLKRIHKGIKAALSPAVWALGTVASPLAMIATSLALPIAAAVAAGHAANENTDKNLYI